MFDAYSQGEMIWLAADTLIRQRTAGVTIAWKGGAR
jgi:predicted metalloprotease with PDZ domain